MGIDPDYKFEIDDGVQHYFDTLNGIKPLKKSEEKELLLKYKNENDINARNKLITSNLKYACKLAYSFKGRGLTVSELISEGYIGLIESIDKFDASNDVKIISYAKWWIMQKIQMAIDKKNKLPLSEIPNENPQDEESEDETVSRHMHNSRESNFIYTEYDKDENDSQVEFIKNVLGSLTNREIVFVKMYYGIDCKDEYTLEDIGRMYGLTKERVRQIIDTAIKKIKSKTILIDFKYLYR